MQEKTAVLFGNLKTAGWTTTPGKHFTRHNITLLTSPRNINTSVSYNTKTDHRTWSRLIAIELGSALTWQATNSCAVEAATCLAEEISFSSLACPWTIALAASHRLCVAAHTRRAYSTLWHHIDSYHGYQMSLQHIMTSYNKYMYWEDVTHRSTYNRGCDTQVNL